MKKIFTLLVLAAVSLSGFAQAPLNSNDNIVFKKNPTIVYGNHLQSNYFNSRSVIWSDDFSNAANWNISSEVPNNQNWVIGTSGPSGGYAISPIQSTTASNGFAMFDSDGMTTTFANQIGDITTANSIDCSSHPGVLLKFQQYYRRFYDSTFVFVSTDNTNWTKISVNTGVAVNDFNADPDGDPNPATVIVNITPYAGGSATVWIRFQFYSPISLQPNASGWCYAWMIDDVSLEDAPANDMTTDNTWLGDGYTIYPTGQEQEVYFANIATNMGATDQTNVKLTATVSPGGFNDVSPAQDFTPASFDTLVVNTTFLPSGVGTYNVTYSTTGDQTDDNPADNTINKSFAVHAYQFARDNGMYDGGGMYNQYDEYTLANYYFVPNATQVGSLDVAFQENTSVGSTVIAHIYTWDGTDWVDQGTSDPYVISSADINTTNGAAHFVTINFQNLIPITDSSDVLAGIESFGGSDTVFIAASSYVQEANLSTIIYDPVATTPGWYNMAGMDVGFIRMNVNSHVGINYIKENTWSASVYPNPANEFSNLYFNLGSSSNVELTVYNSLGEIVFHQNLGTQTAGNHSLKLNSENFSSGIYNVTLQSSTERSVTKLVVAH